MYNPDDKYEFTAFSGLFNAVNNSMFIRDDLSLKVKNISNDQNNLNLNIYNEERLKRILFKKIQNKYNARIDNYGLKLNKLSIGNNFDDLEIVKFYLTEDKNNEHSGYYMIYPRTFECDKCGDFRVFNKEEWEIFNPNKCRHKGCNGKYRQVPFLGFCEDCGEIGEIYINCINSKCKNYQTHNSLKLIKEDVESPSTWKIKCTECGEEYDFLTYCNHDKKSLLNKDRTKFKPINVNSNIFSSVVITTVDILKREESEYIDEILLGAYLEKFDLYEDEDITTDELIDDIIYFLNKLKMYPTEKDRKRARRRGDGDTEVFKKAEKLKKQAESLRQEYEDVSIYEVNDYLVLKQYFMSDETKNIDYKNIIKNTEKVSIDDYNNFKKEFGIEDITYIPNMQLVASSIGSINGINRFYDHKFTPHFEPHWKNHDHEKFKIYSYPFETEGIMFDLDKDKLMEWVTCNSKNPENLPKEKSSREFLFNLNQKSEDYKNLQKLIHTFAHILIKRASIYIGLNSDSCGELLFPKTGAFLIYSTSNVNIGGFSFVFENSLLDWFNNVKLEITECIFDPTCIDEQGACFSCAYLPDYVCSYFNKLLDRDVFLGDTNRVNQGYWKI